MIVRQATTIDFHAWRELRAQLWPECSEERHLDEIHRILAAPDRFAAYFAYDDSDAPLGFLEISLRDFANGCGSSPVAFLEGLYVLPIARKSGVGKALLHAAEDWARYQNCTELASDSPLENSDSFQVHLRLGFQVTERVVCFRKEI